jgi:hypothetical protein
MTWSNKYKKSIDCNNPKGFSQKAHCQARKLRQMGKKTESKPINETIRHEGEKWNIYSKDGSKRLGSYDTETAAKKRLRQIEYFKHMGEDVPVNNVSQGNIAGVGVGAQGEPGVQKKKKVASFISFMTRQGKK